jgi:hypothetical protein
VGLLADDQVARVELQRVTGTLDLDTAFPGETVTEPKP